MQISRLLIVLAFASTVLLAEDQPHSISTAEFRVDTGRPSRNAFKKLRRSESQIGDPDVCYTMRTYMVEQDHPETDSVHPVGYTTCQTAPRFQLKTTTASEEPGPSN